MEILSDERVIVQNNNSNDTSTFQGGIIINHLSEELLTQMKERIEDLKSIIAEKDKRIQQLEKKA
jgi:hypothetical protein